MPVPFETLIPYGIIIAVSPTPIPRYPIINIILTLYKMFGVTGAGLSKIKHMQNGGKRARRSIDQWDRQSTRSFALRTGLSWR